MRAGSGGPEVAFPVEKHAGEAPAPGKSLREGGNRPEGGSPRLMRLQDSEGERRGEAISPRLEEVR
jgi:hypothetical protein